MAEIVAYFAANGVPLTGPAGADIPEVVIVTTPGNVVAQAAIDMTELVNAPGWYQFTFAPADSTEYVWTADGDPAAGNGLSATERYQRGVLSGEHTARTETDIPAILVDTAAMQPLVDVAVSTREAESAAATREATNTTEHGTTLTAVGLNETEVAAAAREATNTAEHAATLAQGGAGPWTTGAGVSDWTAAEREQIRDGIGIDGTKTAAVGGQLQALETEAAAAAREATNTTEHGTTLTAVGLNETEAAAAAREATNTAEHGTTLTAVGLTETEVAAAAREATNTAEHAATLAAVGLVAADVTTLVVRTADLDAALAMFGAILGTPVTRDTTTIVAGGFTWSVGVVGSTVTLTRLT